MQHLHKNKNALQGTHHPGMKTYFNYSLKLSRLKLCAVASYYTGEQYI